MKKFLAVIKREYLARVRTRFFIVATIMGPLMLVLFGVVPVYVARMNIGGPTRLAVVDLSGKVYEHFREALMQKTDEEDHDDDDDIETADANSNREDRMQRSTDLGNARFEVEEVRTNGRSVEEVKRQLNERVRQNQLDGYV